MSNSEQISESLVEAVARQAAKLSSVWPTSLVSWMVCLAGFQPASNGSTGCGILRSMSRMTMPAWRSRPNRRARKPSMLGLTWIMRSVRRLLDPAGPSVIRYAGKHAALIMRGVGSGKSIVGVSERQGPAVPRWMRRRRWWIGQSWIDCSQASLHRPRANLAGRRWRCSGRCCSPPGMICRTFTWPRCSTTAPAFAGSALSMHEPTPERTAFVRFRSELLSLNLDRALFAAVTRQLDRARRGGA